MNSIVDANVWRTLARTLLILLLIAPTSAYASGLTGHVYVRLSDGGIGPPIPGVLLSFLKTNGSGAGYAFTDANGRYSISLAKGRYYVRASHVAYEDYASAPLFFETRPKWQQSKRANNFFLREPVITTVLIVRHAEKQDPNSILDSVPLSAAGLIRARQLKDTLLRAGITAVYYTATKRSRDTVSPLRATFLLPFSSYPYPDPNGATILATEVLGKHRGDVVLVAAHSDTVGLVAKAFCAQLSPQTIDDFDNLYVVSVAGKICNVVNLKYGADNPLQDISMNHKGTMTLLLAGNVAAGGALLPQQLLHIARKAGIAAIYTSSSSTLIDDLAMDLNRPPPVTFSGNDIPAFKARLLADHAQDTVLVFGTHDELRALVLQFGGYPSPVLNANEHDHLIVLTRLASGAARIIPLRFPPFLSVLDNPKIE